MSNNSKQKNKKEQNQADFKKLDKASLIAYYYGFTPIQTPTIKKEDINLSRKLADDTVEKPTNFGAYEDCPIYTSVEEKISLLRTCEEKGLISPSQPTMVYYEGLIKREGEKTKPSKNFKKINLDIIGTGKSIAEAVLIKTALEIIRDEGYADIYLDINSSGDKESIANFSREIQSFNKKHAGEVASECRHEMRKNVLHILQCENKKCQELNETAPKTVTSLSEPSRILLKEVLEFVESMSVPFKLDNKLIGNRKFLNHSIFKIVCLNIDNQPEETVALGFRYNGLAKKVDMGKDTPAVGISITLKRKNANKNISQPKRPKIYFIQLGFEAKIKSLNVIEELRKARIPVYQTLARDKLSSQIATAENLKIPVSIIMGQKEAISNSVIVRDMNTRFQESVDIDKLPDYLKKFKLV